MSDREPLDVAGAAIAALAHLDLSPDHRLREVAGLAILLHSHVESYREAQIDKEEIEASTRAWGRCHADMIATGLPRAGA